MGTDWVTHRIKVTHIVTELFHIGRVGDYSVTYSQMARSFDLIGGHHNTSSRTADQRGSASSLT